MPKIVKNQVATLSFFFHIYLFKVPYEKCDLVPDLDCQFVLKAVPVEECKPTVKQDCRDEAREKPYLEEEEECFEVIYDECFLVSAAIFLDNNYPLLISDRGTGAGCGVHKDKAG